jgi:UDP-2,3-diacylglucosamine pyrophosphatase LpxH
LPPEPERLLAALAPYRDGLVVGCECLFAWYWLADLCVTEGIPFVLGHALYLKAIHGGKTKTDVIDAQKLARLLRGGTFAEAYVYPKAMRATRIRCLARVNLLAIAASSIARFYHEPRLVAITLALSITFLLAGSTVQHMALLKRQLRFRTIAQIQVSSITTGFLAGIGMAWLGYGYWSLSAYLKYRVKSAVAFIGAFEEAVAAEARRRGADGIICGHIHHAADRTFNGVHYLNCGDWVESCSAIVEHHDGKRAAEAVAEIAIGA